jgi:RNA polymerase sigma-70 factor, ECF subfamily
MRRYGAGSTGPDEDLDLAGLLALVARGDHRAFELVHARLAGPVYGLVRQVLRDPAQSEEVTQEVLLEVWRPASRFDPARGSANAWAMTIAHRRAVDRVRSENAGSRRERKVALDRDDQDDVAGAVALRETAARLALAWAGRPPARLEQRVLAASYRIRQLPPLPPRRPAWRWLRAGRG